MTTENTENTEYTEGKKVRISSISSFRRFRVFSGGSSGVKGGGVKARTRQSAPALDHAVGWAYDNAGRLNTVVSNGDTYTYHYSVPNSALLISKMQGPQYRTEYTNEPGRNNRTEVKNMRDGNVVSAFNYRYNALGQRVDVVETGSAAGGDELNKYQYNGAGELIENRRYAGTNPDTPGAAIPARDRDYVFDPIGNRKEATEGANPVNL